MILPHVHTKGVRILKLNDNNNCISRIPLTDIVYHAVQIGAQWPRL